MGWKPPRVRSATPRQQDFEVHGDGSDRTLFRSTHSCATRDFCALRATSSDERAGCPCSIKSAPCWASSSNLPLDPPPSGLTAASAPCSSFPNSASILPLDSACRYKRRAENITQSTQTMSFTHTTSVAACEGSNTLERAQETVTWEESQPVEVNPRRRHQRRASDPLLPSLP